MKKIPYAHQYIDPSDISAVCKALASDWLTQGPKIREFEDVLSAYTGAKYSAVISSGTAALHLAMMALELKKGDEIITSPVTFSASANCAVYVGATPRFIDIDDTTYHMDISKLKAFLTSPSRRRRIKAVIPVHFMGTVSDIPEIKRICDKYGIKVVEDAAHAIGGGYKTGSEYVKTGNCRHSDATIFSFHPIKNITTGEGGAVLTNSRKIYEAVTHLRHHGISRTGGAQGWHYDISQVGFNYRITDFQCALGISQMKRLDKMVRTRTRLVENYNKAFTGVDGIITPYERENTKSAYHLYVIRVAEGRRNHLYDYLRGKGILTQVNYIPVHLLSYYKKTFGYRPGDFPAAERYFGECLSLPLYAGLSEKDQARVINEVKRFFRY